MTIFLSIIAPASILLVLISTSAVVEGTCKCKEVCPNYHREKFGGLGPKQDTEKKCWVREAICLDPSLAPCDAYCGCNFFGCKCNGCEKERGDCCENDGENMYYNSDGDWLGCFLTLNPNQEVRCKGPGRTWVYDDDSFNASSGRLLF